MVEPGVVEPPANARGKRRRVRKRARPAIDSGAERDDGNRRDECAIGTSSGEASAAKTQDGTASQRDGHSHNDKRERQPVEGRGRTGSLH